MAKVIQPWKVPAAVHRELKAQAAREDLFLSEYLIADVWRAADRPSLRELRQGLAGRTPVTAPLSPAEAVRAERAAH